MTDKEIIKTVTGFRKGILGKRNVRKMCYVVCAPLSSYLSLCGCKNDLVEGEVEIDYDELVEGKGNYKRISVGHYWLQLPDNRIIDPTASQFNNMGNPKMPTVYLGKKPKHYTISINQ